MYRRQGSITSPWKRNAKRLPGEALKIAVKRREVKSKGEKERYPHFNAVSKNSKERQERPSSAISAKKWRNNRMGKTRDLFKKIRDTKGTFHAKMAQ